MPSRHIGSLEFFQGTLDSLVAHIAILDRDGAILVVNAAWRNFARTNGLENDLCGPGANYLRVCDLATGECSEEARAVAQGIRDVIDHRTDSFYLEYPCHSPTERRWSRVRVTRFVVEGSVLAVVTHDEITKRKLAEFKAQRANRKLSKLASIDGLTGIPNRRSFDRAMERAWARFSGGGPPFTVALIDVDSFKNFNDHRGHLAGDDCLRAVATTIRTRLRRVGDLAFRYGGEEFAAILPRTDASGAVGAMAGVLEAVRGLSIPHTCSKAGRGVVTVSIGCSSATRGRDASPDDLLHRADRALYVAKSLGRDRLVASEAFETMSARRPDPTTGQNAGIPGIGSQGREAPRR